MAWKILVLVVGFGTALAWSAPALSDDSRPDGVVEAEWKGVIDSIDGAHWVVAGRAVQVDEQTRIDSGVAVGDRVEVEALGEGDALVAHEIELKNGTSDDGDGDDDDDD